MDDHAAFGHQASPAPRRLPGWMRRVLPGRRGKIALGLVAALGVLITVGPQVWVWRHRTNVHTVEQVEPAPVALVLGASVQPSGDPSPFLEDRLETARQLLASGKVQVLLVSGDNRTTHYDEPTAMKRWLIAHGVPPQRIVTDFAGRDSYDSCARAKRIFGVQRLIVVSQSYHIPRAVTICDALGLDTQGVGTDRAAQYAPQVWRSGKLREIPANLKAAWDVLSRRDPILGEPDPSIEQILNP